jgi:hypothetical protein
MKLLFKSILLVSVIILISCATTNQSTTSNTDTSIKKNIPVRDLSNNNQYDIRTIAFYNLENLFDTINDPEKLDERSPIMDMKENKRAKAYWSKIENMAKVIADIGAEKTNTSPAIIGVCEIENKEVLEDLINHKHLKNKHYGIIHYNSPDVRSIDVALLYQKRYFKPMDHKSYELKLFNPDGERKHSRDQLLVTGMLDGEVIHIIVNHWPSRSGGEQRSRPFREKAAALNVKIIKDINEQYKNPKIISMGDLNDDPTNSSIKKIIGAKGKKADLKDGEIYNAMENMHKRGFSTLGYRDNINLFDQILLTSPFITTTQDFSDYKLFQANIFNPRYLTNKTGRYKGYPFRSWSNNQFTGGYSDHYPVYVYLIKEKS